MAIPFYGGIKYLQSQHLEYLKAAVNNLHLHSWPHLFEVLIEVNELS